MLNDQILLQMKRFAVSRLHKKDGTILTNQVIEISDDGEVRYYSLTDELPFTEWHGGDYYLV